jgi:hypothetical protein
LDNMLHLICHSGTPASAVRGIMCMFELGDGRLWVRYHIKASLDRLVLADKAAPERTDGLWKTTCFEVFLMPDGGPEYIELNFAPSNQWAAYHFSSYRLGMRAMELSTPPEIGLDMGDDYFALEAIVELPNLSDWLDITAALSVVVEESDGTKSYWALAHPDGAPDFHHKDSFKLEAKARSGL